MTSNEDRRVIEINGVKFEVDLRSAKRIDEVRCGDRVKVLQKGYGDSYSIHMGVVVGFTEFKALPTIAIAYFKADYSSAELKILHYNAKSADVEICVCTDDDAIDMSKADALAALDKKIAGAEAALVEAKNYKDYFLRNFGKWWSDAETKQGAAS